MLLGSSTPSVLAEDTTGLTFWPFYTRDKTVFGEERIRALGPIFQRVEATNGASLVGVHPLYSRAQLPERQNQREHQVLWPLWFGRGLGHQYKWQVLALLFWHDYDTTLAKSKHHLWLLPFYFQGRNADGAYYMALFPIGGKIRDFLGSDEMGFVLFPLYGYSRIMNQKTHTALWPVFSRTDGPNIQRGRVFPFYGYARCRNYYEKLFLFWPLWTHSLYSYRKSSGYGYFMFPIWGHLNVTDQEAWWFAPPFVRISTRGDNRLYYLPWPFLQISHGEIEKFYIWPVWGSKRAYGFPYTFALWPVVRYWEEDEGGLLGDQLMIMPVWYSRTQIKPAGEKGDAREVIARESKFWPFYNYRRNGNRSCLGVPALCPFRNVEAIERNYAPLWTLYTRQRNNNKIEDDLLWGLCRYRRGPGEKSVELFPLFRFARDENDNTRSWSFLKGFVARQQHENEVKFTLFYAITWRVRIGATPDEPAKQR